MTENWQGSLRLFGIRLSDTGLTPSINGNHDLIPWIPDKPDDFTVVVVREGETLLLENLPPAPPKPKLE